MLKSKLDLVGSYLTSCHNLNTLVVLLLPFQESMNFKTFKLKMGSLTYNILTEMAMHLKGLF